MTKLVEDEANGPAVVQSLKHEITGLIEVQPEGKRRMTAAEFLSGHRLRTGERPFGGGVP